RHQHVKLRRALKLPEGFVLHSLRHTFLTRLGASGADAFSIKRIAGHSSLTISEKYIHPTPGRLDAYDSVLWTWLLAFPVPPRRFFDGLCQVDGENTGLVVCGHPEDRKRLSRSRESNQRWRIGRPVRPLTSGQALQNREMME